MVGFNFAPTGWATCDGQLLPISQNTALFSLIGTYYGGNGQSNFALPNLRDSFASVENGEINLFNVNIGSYSHRGYADHVPTRTRKLLLHRAEINKLLGKGVDKGMTIVPLRMYFKGGRVKVAIAMIDHTDDSRPLEVPESTTVAGPVRADSAISLTGP